MCVKTRFKRFSIIYNLEFKNLSYCKHSMEITAYICVPITWRHRSFSSLPDLRSNLPKVCCLDFGMTSSAVFPSLFSVRRSAPISNVITMHGKEPDKHA